MRPVRFAGISTLEIHSTSEAMGRTFLMNALLQFFPKPPLAKPEDRAKYERYLDSLEWELKRNAVFQREKGICQGCGDSPIENVHHLTYLHIYHELLFELVGLCETCHCKCHFIGWPEGRGDYDY